MQIADIIYSELSVFGSPLIYHCKNGVRALQNRFTAVCDQTGWLSELVHHNNSIKVSIETLGLLVSTRRRPS